MQSPVRETAEVAGGVLDVLRNQPSTVAMIVISFALLFFLWYTQSSYSSERAQLTQLILEHQRETQAVLAKCVEPAQVETIIKQLELNRSSYNEMLTNNMKNLIDMLKRPVEQRQ
jgi:hypothetical protein